MLAICLKLRPNCVLARLICLMPAITLTSCDLSRELNENTLALSTTVSQIHNQQIIENLQVFIDDGYAMPAQVTLSGGGVQVTNSISPSFASFIRPWKSFSASLSNSFTQNWSVAPVNDPDDIRRLRALYRLVIYGYRGDRGSDALAFGGGENFPSKEDFEQYQKMSKTANFDVEYPRVSIYGMSNQQTDVLATTDPNATSALRLPAGRRADRVSTVRTITITRQSQALLDTGLCDGATPDPACPTHPYYFPLVRNSRFVEPVRADNLRLVQHGWLFWSDGPLGIGAPNLPFVPPAGSQCVRLWPHYISTTRFSHTLYSCSPDSKADAWRQFDEFAMWIWAATSNSLGNGGGGAQGGGGGSGAGAGGGGSKPKASPATVLTSPVEAGH